MTDLRLVKTPVGGAYDVYIGERKTGLQVECNPLAHDEWNVFAQDEYVLHRKSLCACRQALVMIAEALEMEPA